MNLLLPTHAMSLLALNLALLSPGAALARPAIVDRAPPTTVTTVTARDLENLPQGRDLKSILDLHNQLRADVHAEPLRWDQGIADHALDYARTLAETGQMQHSSRVGRATERENLSLSPHGVTGAVDLARLWGGERRLFHPGIFPDVCSGDWSQCAHYTQMIWPTTTSLGCGFYSGARYDALVCRYSPPGNRDGSPVISMPATVISQTPVVRMPASEGGDNGAPGLPQECVGQANIKATVEARICAAGNCPGAVNKCYLQPPAGDRKPEPHRYDG